MKLNIYQGTYYFPKIAAQLVAWFMFNLKSRAPHIMYDFLLGQRTWSRTVWSTLIWWNVG